VKCNCYTRPKVIKETERMPSGNYEVWLELRANKNVVSVSINLSNGIITEEIVFEPEGRKLSFFYSNFSTDIG
jgi:hypothetical protein